MKTTSIYAVEDATRVIEIRDGEVVDVWNFSTTPQAKAVRDALNANPSVWGA